MKISRSDSTGLIGIGALVAARSIHWLITPMRHSHASAVRYAAMWLSLAAALAMIGYGVYIRRRERSGAFTD